MTGGRWHPTMSGVTDSAVTSPEVREVTDRAAWVAEAAARSAGVVMREISEVAGLEAVVELYEKIWRRDGNPPVTIELLRAFAKAGNYVAGAFDGDVLLGACVGFFSAPADGAMHSHIAGVSGAARGRNVGFALKLHQRAWALQRGVSVIAWTFDPLVSRNAWFNLVKLGALAVEYLPNFYGGMRDGINGTDDSDRLLVHWELTSPSATAASAGLPRADGAVAEPSAGSAIALGRSALGAPVRGPLDAPVSLVAVPPDIEALRVTDPGLAKEWRMAVRESLGTLLAGGGVITGFDRAGGYVVRRDAEQSRPDW